MSANEVKDEGLKGWRFKVAVVSVIALVITLWVASYFVVGAITSKPGKPGPFGDLFGAVNALFSGLALAGIVFAIYLQRRDLRLQATELKRSADAHVDLVGASRITAELTALSKLIELCEVRVQAQRKPHRREPIQDEMDGYVTRLKQLVAKIEEAESDDQAQLSDHGTIDKQPVGEG